MFSKCIFEVGACEHGSGSLRLPVLQIPNSGIAQWVIERPAVSNENSDYRPRVMSPGLTRRGFDSGFHKMIVDRLMNAWSGSLIIVQGY